MNPIELAVDALATARLTRLVTTDTYRVDDLPTDRRRYVEVDANGCWIWQGQIGNHGYGRWRGREKAVEPGERGKPIDALAHRKVYELLVGPIPKGLTLDHLCRVRVCVNPGHLEPVTAEENVRRGDHRKNGANFRDRDACSNGHKYTEETTRVEYRRYGPIRACRICDREKAQRHRDRHRLSRDRTTNAACD